MSSTLTHARNAVRGGGGKTNETVLSSCPRDKRRPSPHQTTIDKGVGREASASAAANNGAEFMLPLRACAEERRSSTGNARQYVHARRRGCEEVASPHPDSLFRPSPRWHYDALHIRDRDAVRPAEGPAAEAKSQQRLALPEMRHRWPLRLSPPAGENPGSARPGGGGGGGKSPAPGRSSPPGRAARVCTRMDHEAASVVICAYIYTRRDLRTAAASRAFWLNCGL